MFSCGAILSVLLAVGSANDSLRVLREMDLEAAPHSYYLRETKDRFGRLQKEIEAGRVELDRSGEKAFLSSLLKALEIPASSQMLVFSTTSLQLSLITPSNPRALYFNEDTYLGFIPGGKIEIVSIDPEIGGDFLYSGYSEGQCGSRGRRKTRTEPRTTIRAGCRAVAAVYELSFGIRDRLCAGD